MLILAKNAPQKVFCRPRIAHFVAPIKVSPGADRPPPPVSYDTDPILYDYYLLCTKKLQRVLNAGHYEWSNNFKHWHSKLNF